MIESVCKVARFDLPAFPRSAVDNTIIAFSSNDFMQLHEVRRFQRLQGIFKEWRRTMTRSTLHTSVLDAARRLDTTPRVIRTACERHGLGVRLGRNYRVSEVKLRELELRLAASNTTGQR